MRLEASRAYVKTLTDGQMVCTHARLCEDVYVCECTLCLHYMRAYIKTRVDRSYVRRASCMHRFKQSRVE